MGKRTNTAKWMPNQRRWQINVQKDGTRRTFTSSKPGRTGQREANAKADAWLDEGIDAGRKTLAQLFSLYLDDLKARTSYSNWQGVERRWRLYAVPVIGRLTPDRLSDRHLQQVISRAYSERHLAKKTLQNLRADLVSFCKYMRKARMATYTPEDITIPQSATRSEKRILQPQDLRVLFQSDETINRGKPVPDPYINAYRFQAVTGLRPGELIALQWADIRDGRCCISRSINVYGEQTQGKNANAVRSFSLSPLAAKILADQRPLSDGKSVFCISSERSYYRHFKAYCQHNGLPPITPYELRHTFVSVIQSMPEAQVKSLVGHSKNMDTFGTYGHDFGDRQDAVAEQVDSIFTAILASQK